jgi:hypothetical protein
MSEPDVNPPDDLPEVRALFQAVTPPPGLDRWRAPQPAPAALEGRPRRRKLVLAACAAVVALLAGGIPAAIALSGSAPPPPRPAVTPSVSARPSATPSATPTPSQSPPAAPPPSSPAAGRTRPATPTTPPPSTGVPTGTALRQSNGDLIIETPGTVVDAMQVNGSIIVQAPNVHIRRTRVAPPADAFWVIRQAPGATDLVIEDSELDGNQIHDGISQEAAGLTVRRTRIHDVDVGVSLSDRGDVEDCLLTAVGAGIGTDAGGTQISVLRTTITTTADSGEAAIGLYTAKGSLHAVTVESNVLAGGNYTFHVGEGPGTQQITARHNRFSRAVHPNGGVYGPTAGWDAAAPGNVWQDNTWSDTGAPVDP